MKVTVNLTKKEIEVIREHQTLRMQWIQIGMDEKEPIDLVVQKVLNAADEQAKEKESN